MPMYRIVDSDTVLFDLMQDHSIRLQYLQYRTKNRVAAWYGEGIRMLQGSSIYADETHYVRGMAMVPLSRAASPSPEAPHVAA
jgi:hypothetical protein